MFGLPDHWILILLGVSIAIGLVAACKLAVACDNGQIWRDDV